MTTMDTNGTDWSTEQTISRRGVLRTVGGVAATGAVLGGASTGASGQSAETDLDSWFENTSNYDGPVDHTDSDSVTVEVGAQANGGAFGFGPAAIRVAPGTTVTWSWTGKGGSHNVADTDGDFESDLVDSEGHTFEHTFENEGTYTYSCVPHETMGMKGAIIVGGSAGESGGTPASGGSDAAIASPFGDTGTRSLGGLAIGGVLAAALASPGLFGAFVWLKERGKE